MIAHICKWPAPLPTSPNWLLNPLPQLSRTHVHVIFQSQPPAPNMMKPGPSMIQSLPPPTTFSVPAQGPPPSLLQAQLSAASLAPLLQNPPQPLLPQPPPKGRITYASFLTVLKLEKITQKSCACYIVLFFLSVL